MYFPFIIPDCNRKPHYLRLCRCLGLSVVFFGKITESNIKCSTLSVGIVQSIVHFYVFANTIQALLYLSYQISVGSSPIFFSLASQNARLS